MVLAIVALEVPLSSSVADRVNAEVRSQARGQADLVAATVADLLDQPNAKQRQRVVDVIAGNTRGRVIVVDRRGRLLTDSGDGTAGTSYRGRPEIQAALAGKRDQRERTSASLEQSILATSVPVLGGGRPVGAVRITQSIDAVDRAVKRARTGLVLIGLLVLGVGLLVGWLIAGAITRPLRRLDATARRVADGDLSARVKVEGSAEQQSLSRTFNLMTERVERLVDSQRLFVADASHQLRTPLTGVRLRMEAVQASRLEPDAAANVDAALTELDRLSGMITELLELSSAGERDAAGERLSLSDVAARAAQRWHAAAEFRRQRIEALDEATDGAPAWIAEADADRIVDVLVENALHYSPAGAAVELVTRDGVLEVRDRGAGLTAEEAEQVFERFHRGSAGRQGEAGTGLGLAIARELASRWGGSVTLNPRPGGGTVAQLNVGNES